MKEMKQAFPRMRHQFTSWLCCCAKEGEQGTTMLNLNQSGVLLRNNSQDQSPVNIRQSFRFNRSSTQSCQSRTHPQSQMVGPDFIPATLEQSQQTFGLVTVNQVEPDS
jgi:hypothetical protein